MNIPIKKIMGKRNIRYISWLLSFLIAIVDLCVLLTAFFLTATIGRGFDIPFPSSLHIPVLPAPFLDVYFYPALFVFFFVRLMFKGHYTSRLPWYSQIGSILYATFLTGLVDVCFTFLKNPALLTLMQPLFWGLTCVLLIIGRLLSFQILKSLKSWQLPTVLVGNAPTIEDVLYALHADGHTGYCVHAIILLNAEKRPLDMRLLPERYRSIPVIPDLQEAITFMQQNKRNLYYIIDLAELAKSRNESLLKEIEKTDLDWGAVPNIKFLDVYRMNPHYFFGNDVMFLHKRNIIPRPMSRLVKRMIDILAVSFFMPFLLILTVLVWGAKKLEGSSSPVFYNGIRIGKNGKVFKCWKFCTMQKNADQILEDVLSKDATLREEWDLYHKMKNDPRIDSRVSAFLRKSSLDELPQLFNVLIGDMSLVGPRPILPEEREDYGDKIKNYISVSPGLTGLWQVSGRNDTTFEKRIYWDSWYIRNWSLWHDFVILFKTIRVFARADGAY